MQDEKIKKWLEQAKTIAVYGMQDESRPETPAYQIPKHVQQYGYVIYPVNPKIQSSLGCKAYAKLEELPIRPDILNVFRKSEWIPKIVDEIQALPVEKRPFLVWLQTGISHVAAEDQLREMGIEVVSNECLGVAVSRFLPKPGSD